VHAQRLDNDFESEVARVEVAAMVAGDQLQLIEPADIGASMTRSSFRIQWLVAWDVRQVGMATAQAVFPFADFAKFLSKL
jgi:hypothetical protein